MSPSCASARLGSPVFEYSALIERKDCSPALLGAIMMRRAIQRPVEALLDGMEPDAAGGLARSIPST